MKKLSLKKLVLSADDLIQREVLKTIVGGGYGGDCKNDDWCSEGCLLRVAPNAWICSFCYIA